MKAAIEFIKKSLSLFTEILVLVPSLRQVLVVLEASEKVDKENALNYFLEGMSQGRDHVEVMSPYRDDHNIKEFDRARDEITALLESLPDKEK